MEESSNGETEATQKVEPEEVTKKPEESENPELFLKEEQKAGEQDVRAEKLVEADVLSEETTVTRGGSPMDEKDIEDENFQALSENPNGVPPILTDVYEEDAEVQLLPSDEKPESSSEVVVIDAEPKGTDQEKLSPSSDENVEASLTGVSAEETEEKAEPGLEENAEDSSKTSASNHPIISLADRSGQPATATTWMSCCGLFQVLRRSNR